MKDRKPSIFLAAIAIVTSILVINSNKTHNAIASSALLTSGLESDHTIYMPFVRRDPPIYTHIVFDTMRNGQREIYIMGADGSLQTRLTNHPWMDFDPDVSPDGQCIVFWTQEECGCPPEIHTMNINGTDRVPLVTTIEGIWFPDWSPDGERIAVVESQDNQLYIWLINIDGSNPTQLTEGTSPNWSPSGGQILFTDSGNIYVIDSDGSHRTYVTTGHTPVWLPDSKHIGYISSDNLEENNEIYIADADGSNVQRLTYTDEREFTPTWSPDGKKVAFGACRKDTTPAGQTCDIYVMNADGSERIRLTDSRDMGASESSPSWAP